MKLSLSRSTKLHTVRGCTPEFPPRKKKFLFVPRMQKKIRRAGRALSSLQVKPEPPSLPIISQHLHNRNRPPVGMIPQCSYYELTALATQWHGGFTCVCHCVAKIVSSRLPVEKNCPRTPQSDPTTMGFLLPSGKVPLTQQVSCPPPPSNDTFLPIDPPNVLSTLIKQEGAREDTTKSSNRPDIKIRPDDGPRQINALPLPPCFACIRERQQRNKTLMFR